MENVILSQSTFRDGMIQRLLLRGRGRSVHVNKSEPVYRYFKVKFYNDFTPGKQLGRLNSHND